MIVGPTAVGKTALSISLAQQFNGEIISGDSLQIYRSLDIGTAKATAEEQAGIPHYLIDERDIHESYSAADFQQAARKQIAAIAAKGKLPIVVGGTGLYIQALLYDFQLGSKGPEDKEKSEEIRRKYEALAEEKGNDYLWRMLAERDQAAANAIHFNNRRKVIRALEVLEVSGTSIIAEKQPDQLLYDCLIIGLNTQRELLYQRINQRVDQMLAAGVLEEARRLYQLPDVQAAQGIGYKEFFPYFSGVCDLEEAVEQVKLHSRRYAKRQLTWFRNRMQVHWVDLITAPEEQAAVESEVADWIKG